MRLYNVQRSSLHRRKMGYIVVQVYSDEWNRANQPLRRSTTTNITRVQISIPFLLFCTGKILRVHNNLLKFWQQPWSIISASVGHFVHSYLRYCREPGVAAPATPVRRSGVVRGSQHHDLLNRRRAALRPPGACEIARPSEIMAEQVGNDIVVLSPWFLV